MDTGQQQPKNAKLLRIGAVLAVLVVAAVVALLAWHSHHKSSPEQSALPAGWAHYSNQTYGFQFDYPSKWGTPTVNTTTSSENKDQTGVIYTVSFKDVPVKNYVNISFQSTDYTQKFCHENNKCDTIDGLTSSDIKSYLSSKEPPIKPVKSDPDSIAMVVYKACSDQFCKGKYTRNGTLSISQIVDFPKIKVNAVNLAYSLLDPSSDCQDGTLPTDSSNCISQTDFTTLNKVAKSLAAI